MGGWLIQVVSRLGAPNRKRLTGVKCEPTGDNLSGTMAQKRAVGSHAIFCEIASGGHVVLSGFPLRNGL
jgi:hypothetical protein